MLPIKLLTKKGDGKKGDGGKRHAKKGTEGFKKGTEGLIFQKGDGGINF